MGKPALNSVDRIVVGFDFSDTATHAVSTALWIAKRVEARVHIGTGTMGHIDPEASVFASGEGGRRRRPQNPDDNPHITHIETHCKERIDKLGLEGVDVTYRADSQRPYQLLTDMASRSSADIIIVGSSGLGAVKRWLVGSTADKLVRGSPYPVMVIKAHCPIRKILCAVDLSRASAEALHWAWTLAMTFDAQLHTVNVAEVPKDLECDLYGQYWTEDYRKKLVRKENKAYNAFLDESAAGSMIVERHTAPGVADDVICDTATRIEADLLVLGSQGRHGISAMIIGNTANRVLHRLPCSLLTVKDRQLTTAEEASE